MSLYVRTLMLVFAGVMIPGYASWAKDNDFNCNTISDAMKKHANAVVRESHEEIRIVSSHEVYVTKSIAITILNEKGKNYAPLKEFHNHFITIESIQGKLYDSSGAEVRKLKQKSINDIAPSGPNLIDDNYVEYADFGYVSYPYTVEYETETKLSTPFYITPWAPKNGHDCSVESADIKVTYPKDFPLRYRAFHTNKIPVAGTDGDNYSISMSLNEIAAGDKPDEFAPMENYYFPTLILAADKFDVDGETYSMATWHDFGDFYYRLNVNRDQLPDATKKVVHQLTDTCRSDNEKISLLYEYLKKNTRYVSIQLGVGGWQSLNAAAVSEKGYGDCKALSNYMKSLLKEAGITAYPALAFGAEKARRKMIMDFPYNSFNHAILCVPRPHDTVWLECTSKTLPAGYLSSFTSDRYVLLVTPDGGFPVKTPTYNTEVNSVVRKADIYIDDKDEMHGNIDLKYRGYMWEKEDSRVVDAPKSKIENYLNSKFSVVNYKIDNFKISNDISGTIPSLEETVSLTGNGNITRTGNSLFLSSYILPLRTTAPTSYEERKRDFHIGPSYIIKDTITFHLGGRYTMSGPKAVTVNDPFANYWSKAVLENDSTLVVTRLYIQMEGLYLPELYDDYMKLSKEVNIEELNSKIVLTKKD